MSSAEYDRYDTLNGQESRKMCYIFVNGCVSWLKQLVTHHTQAEQVIIHDGGVAAG